MVYAYKMIHARIYPGKTGPIDSDILLDIAITKVLGKSDHQKSNAGFVVEKGTFFNYLDTNFKT